jgi:hypothetical protein
MSRKMMIKTLTGLLLTLTLLNPVANADPFSTTWEWVEEHPDIGVPQSNASLKKSAFTVELNSSKVENIIPVLLKTS